MVYTWNSFSDICQLHLNETKKKKKEKYIKTLLRAKFHVVFLPQLLKIRTRGVNLKTRGSAHIQNKNSAYTTRLRSH